MTQSEQQRENGLRKKLRSSASFRTITRSNIYVIGVPEEEEKEGEATKVLKEIMTNNFSNLTRDITYRFKKLRDFQTR